MGFDLDRIGGQKALDALVAEMLSAGEEALRLYRAGAANRTKKKPDRSPVTEADEAVEKRLRAFLTQRWPDAGFLGEETGSAGAGDEELRWVVDPIDGTRAFIRGIPTWSILVGLEHLGEPVVGVAYMPAGRDLFVAVQGGGAWDNGRPIEGLSRIAAVEDAVVTHGALSQFTDLQLGHLLPRLGKKTYTQRGFADFDGYRQLLRGHVDAMIDPGVAPWDICPAAVLVREAGGRLTSLSGEHTIHGGSSVASNAELHEGLIALLAPPAEA